MQNLTSGPNRSVHRLMTSQAREIQTPNRLTRIAEDRIVVEVGEKHVLLHGTAVTTNTTIIITNRTENVSRREVRHEIGTVLFAVHLEVPVHPQRLGVRHEAGQRPDVVVVVLMLFVGNADRGGVTVLRRL